MKALSGGLLTDAAAAYAYLDQFENVLPIWGVQRESELEEFISFMEDAPQMTPERQALIQRDRSLLSGEFCRACGYCMPCPKGITISQCARMIQLIRRSPSAQHLSEESQAMMERITACVDCGACRRKCPYGLPVPELLKKNLEDYRRIVAGEIEP
jgi:predicted aldo/keto reductase-like oxidoreductase